MEAKDREQLYNDFQKAFPLEKLKDMTLEQYTNLNREDSFCYWLESKTSELGSIWGGAAYKFGIFKFDKFPKQDNGKYTHDDNYSWSSRLGSTSEEAFNNVKNAIVKIAEHASNAQWNEIEKINELWPVTTWKIAFLYSNMSLVPIYKRDMLDTLARYFKINTLKGKKTSDIQQFLMKQKGDKNLFVFYGELLSILEAENKKKTETKQEIKYWICAPGDRASKWDLCQQDNIISIGWDEMGDYRQYPSLDDVKKRMQTIYDKPDASFKNDSLAIWQFCNEMTPGDIIYAKAGQKKFVGRGIVMSEYIYNEDYSDYMNVRRVKWTHIGEWEAPHNTVQKTLTDVTQYTNYVRTLEDMFEGKESRRYWWLVASPKIWSFDKMKVGEEQDYTLYNDNGNQRRIFQNFLDAKEGDLIIGYEATPTKKIVALAEVSKDTDDKYFYFKKTETLLSAIDFLSIKENPVFAGMEFFKNMNGSLFKLSTDEYKELMDVIREQNPIRTDVKSQKYEKENFLSDVFMNEEEYDKLTMLLKMKKNVILQGAPGVGKTYSAKRLAYALMGEKDDSRIEFVQFHQNYSYEDFIMGYKPNTEGGFELRNGIFYNFCKVAQNNPEKQHFFIIDEINRGNLSKIFGELLMLIESDYRDTEIKLAYKDELFSVPKNLYIIGMMNTADRSLAMIDYALRRRFSFFEMKPGFDSIGFIKYQKEVIGDTSFVKVIDGIKNLNDTIEKEFGRGFCIGHSYFCKPNTETYTIAWLKNVIEFDIKPMILEYWFDNEKKAQQEIDKLTLLLQ